MGKKRNETNNETRHAAVHIHTQTISPNHVTVFLDLSTKPRHNLTKKTMNPSWSFSFKIALLYHLKPKRKKATDWPARFE